MAYQLHDIDKSILRQHVKWLLDTDGDEWHKDFDHRHFRRGWDGDIYPKALNAIAHEISVLAYEPEAQDECDCSGQPRQFDDGTVADAMFNYISNKQGLTQSERSAIINT